MTTTVKSEVLYKVTATSDILPEGSLYISHRKVRVLIIVETLFPRKINHKRNKKIDYVVFKFVKENKIESVYLVDVT